MNLKKAFIISFALLIAGCGYSTGSRLPSYVKTIYIPTFINRIDVTQEVTDRYGYKLYKPGMEIDLTNAVVNRFIYYGKLKVVKTEDEADLVLKGELSGYQRDPLAYSPDTQEVEEYRLTILANINLIDKKAGEISWDESNFGGDTTYYTSGSLAVSEETAIRNAVNDLARRIVDRTVEGW